MSDLENYSTVGHLSSCLCCLSVRVLVSVRVSACLSVVGRKSIFAVHGCWVVMAGRLNVGRRDDVCPIACMSAIDYGCSSF